MTIDEAIEIKARAGDKFLHTDPDDVDEADRLSIEALKRLASNRLNTIASSDDLLPGETKD